MYYDGLTAKNFGICTDIFHPLNSYHGCIEGVTDVIVIKAFGNDFDTSYIQYPASLLQVFDLVGYPKTQANITSGIETMQAGLLLERTFLLENYDLLTWMNQDQHLTTYPYGGLEDMAMHVAAAWQLAYEQLSESSAPQPYTGMLVLAR
jgi:hypothetical protein